MAGTRSPSLTIFYIVEPPEYEAMACYLLASIRMHFPAKVKCVGYCPEHRLDELHPAIHAAHEKLGGEIRTFRSEGRFDPPYPHGNKMLAALEPRDTTYSMFVDSDVLFLRPNDARNIVKAGHVSCSMAASMVWAEQTIWDTIYGALDMPVPEERYYMMRRKARKVVPYFSSGLVAFPEKATRTRRRFPDVWYETAQIIDKVDSLDRRRPYLDQMALPAAIQRAGLKWNILPEEQHFILGGKLKGKPLPENREIYTIHYRSQKHLRDVGHHKTARGYLHDLTGEKYVRRLAPDAETSLTGAAG
ncbi:hypothetical protein DDZ14_03405 [Maritimibacter sp. 55A14]|uniref:hypothetical protein n=1 Tax=Maritimibacter sp. 55A14 TaxID=2174844 RepID=UPI000D622194|nr:hypothetical protein [Maritimibacter sp. 55A14]PWE33725.1 hypothetical protein DDZ14_03405 [Maritimibacter sp. 55A14]